VQAVGNDVDGVVVGIARARGGIVGRDRPQGVDGSRAVGGVGNVGLARGRVRLGQAGNGLDVPGAVVWFLLMTATSLSWEIYGDLCPNWLCWK
jgi:hypothetical protein